MTIWTNKAGQEFEIRPSPPWLAQVIKDRFEMPQPPTYKVSTVGGGQAEYPHTEQSIQNASDEDKKAWETYKTTLANAHGKVFETQLKEIVKFGLIQSKPDNDFIEQVRAYSPDTTDEKIQEYWLWNHVAPSEAEKIGLYIAIQEISTLNEEMEVMLESVRSSFRLIDNQKRHALELVAKEIDSQMARAYNGNGIKGNERMGYLEQERLVQLAPMGTG